MALSFIRWRSLKTRITLFTLAFFLISIWVLAFYVSLRLRDDMQVLLAKQQVATVSIKADALNQALDERLSALGRTAGLLDQALLKHPAALSKFLEQRPVLLNQFSGGVVVLGLEGSSIAEASYSAQSVPRIGASYSHFDSVAAALNDGRSTISRPFMDPHRQAPVFVMTVPIRDDEATVIGALVGVTILGQTNFLDPVIEGYYGKQGYMLLAETKTRQIVSATGRVRILQEISPNQTPPLFERFAQGSAETGITVDVTGVEVLASAKRVPVADWFLVAAMPTDEAFVLIHDMKLYMLQATLFLTLLAGALTWWMIRRELSPMLSAMKVLASLSDSQQPPQALPIASHDEIGELISGFNGLLGVLGQREAALRDSDARFRALHDASFGGIMIHDQGTILDCNQGLANLTGYSANELIGMNGIQLTAPEWHEMVVRNITNGMEQAYDVEGLRKDGSRYNLSIRGKNIPYQGRTVRVTEFRDITERKQMEERARQMALHDTLTQLPNRRLLSDRLRQSMSASQRSGSFGALMFLDLDNFKPLNDTHGHSIGDSLLVEVARRLCSCVREMDTVARFGGDEFVVMLSALSSERVDSTHQAQKVAEKIRVMLAKPYRLATNPFGEAAPLVEHHCTVSIGLTLFKGNEVSETDLLKWADQAMYQAKASGRNVIRFYEIGV